MKSTTLIGVENTDLTIYPHPFSDFKPDANTQITIGDLHANALKLIHFLVFQQVFVMSEEDYQAIVRIYDQDNSKERYKKFVEILERIKVNPVGLVRLIGDELADRGKNDYYILKILEKLGKNNIPFEILFSNHSAEFYAETTLNKHAILPGWDDQRKSLNNYLAGIKDGTFDAKEMKEIIEKFYLPNLKALSYSIDQTTSPPLLNLYTHAPVGLETVKGLAELFLVKYQDNSLEALCKTIDQINEQFKKRNPAQILTREFESSYNTFNDKRLPLSCPISRLTWARGDYLLQLPKTQNGYALRVIHGHEGTYCPMRSHRDNMTNLDYSNLGKINLNTDFYYSLFSQEKLRLENSLPEAKEKKDANGLSLADINLVESKSVISEVKKSAPTFQIPIQYLDRKEHPVLKDKIKTAISTLNQHVKKREDEHQLKFMSFFRGREYDATCAEKFANALQNKPIEKLTPDEYDALNKEPLNKIVSDLRKDDLLPEAMIQRRYSYRY